MHPNLDDIITAVASPPGPAARGIVRAGGANVVALLERLFAANDDSSVSRIASATRTPGTIALNDVPLPVDLYLWPTKRSYTGQPLAELHTLGSPPLLDELVSRLCDLGARPARRGEFTLRAFLAGRVDLVQAEAVLGVIDADDHVELETALRQLGGGLSSRMHVVRNDLLELLADLEAGLDFVDEDIEFVPAADVVRRLTASERFIRDLLERSAGRHRTTGRRTVVLAGLPNAGKSTLFNRLAGRDRALVSDEAGTTRDFLSAEIDLDRLQVELVDTAGWEWEPGALSREAQQRRHEQLERADLVLWCTAADLDEEARTVDQRLRNEVLESGRPLLRVTTKSDLSKSDVGSRNSELDVSEHADPAPLVATLQTRLATDTRDRGELLTTTAARSRDSLAGAAESLARARSTAESSAGDELVSLELRDALDHFGRILGLVYTDDVLDRIFSKFCIGK